MQLTHGSLFSGIGGFDLGFERAGIKTLWQVELNDYCRKVLARHFPRAEQFYSVTTAGEHDWRLPRIDIISGGFPCQDISNAGNREGINGKRSGLWAHYARIVRELRPSWVVVENVAALLDRGMGRVLGDLAALGYDAEWECIRASDFGAPHRRERIFIVAHSAEIGRRLPAVFTGLRAKVDDWQADYGKARVDSWNRSERVPPASVRMADGLSNGLDLDRIGALGNAIVPQIAEWIGRRIVELESNCLIEK